jgi:hypothetical protein
VAETAARQPPFRARKRHPVRKQQETVHGEERSDVAIQEYQEKQSTGLLSATAFGLAAKGLSARNDAGDNCSEFPKESQHLDLLSLRHSRPLRTSAPASALLHGFFRVPSPGFTRVHR